MAATVAVTSRSHLPGGEVILRGTMTMDSLYATGGEVADLSATVGGSPTVIVAPDDGYVLQHNRGTASAGTILAYYQSPNTNSAGTALIQAAVNTNLAAVIGAFIAIGTTV